MTKQETADRDVMQDRWCCLTCCSVFRFGQLRFAADGLACPVCRSTNTAAADGRVYEDVPNG